MSSMAVPPAGERGSAWSYPARPGTDRPEADPVAETKHPASLTALDPKKLAYLMGPVAFGALVVMMSFGLVAKEPIWLWLAVFVAIPAASLIADNRYEARRTEFRLHARVAIQAAAVTTVIYLSGWGPVLCGAFAFLALENVSRCGSRVWRITTLWSLLGIGPVSWPSG